MPQITLKETITKTIDIQFGSLLNVIDCLTEEEKTQIMAHLVSKARPGKVFKKDRIENIVSDFRAADLYEEDFLKDLEEGLKRSSPYSAKHADNP